MAATSAVDGGVESRHHPSVHTANMRRIFSRGSCCFFFEAETTDLSVDARSTAIDTSATDVQRCKSSF